MNLAALLVRSALIALGCGVLAAAAALLGHAAWTDFLHHRREPQLQRARTVFRELLATTTARLRDTSTRTTDASRAAARERREQLAVLRALKPREREALVLPLAEQIELSARPALLWVARELGLVARGMALTRHRLWWQRLRGARLLTVTGGGDEVMPALLRDPHASLRAQAARWATLHPSPAIACALLERITDPDDAARSAVHDALCQLQSLSTAPLMQLLEQCDGPHAEAALALGALMPQPDFQPLAVRHCAHEAPGVRAHAIALLAIVGDANASHHIVRGLEDEDAGVRAAAVRALGRMGQWHRAPALAARLRDNSWDVRRAAGLTLRSLGSPGLTVLRRMTTDGNSFAADMARQVLDLPAGVAEVFA